MYSFDITWIDDIKLSFIQKLNKYSTGMTCYIQYRKNDPKRLLFQSVKEGRDLKQKRDIKINE